jgi:hypothetical protein
VGETEPLDMLDPRTGRAETEDVQAGLDISTQLGPEQKLQALVDRGQVRHAQPAATRSA